MIGGNYYYPKGAVCAHEKGHARGYLEKRKPDVVELMSISTVIDDIEFYSDLLKDGDKATRYMEYSNRYANEDEIAWFVTQGFTRKDTEEDGKTKILFSKNK